ncbi:unnamed protein product [Staurois parvus]|uniref:Transferrin receptor protein 1 n=1 Tax=Staurois parvus TaxID=386267 RepID=A0ABN9AH78_9NEOB|nr:unnamed protein product [Staurois parvus]
MTMERARTAVTNFFGRVPLTYTRFSLMPQTDGDASQVEMKLADDEECGDTTLGEPVIKHREDKNGSRSLCLKVLAVILLFFIGFLIGYLSHRGRVSATQQTEVDGSNKEEDAADLYSHDVPSVLYWSDLRPMLDKRIELLNFKTSISNLYGSTRDAGSDNEESLAAVMDREFTNMGLDKVWSEEHFVTLQDKGRSNKVQLFTSDGLKADFELTSYVAYSPAGSVTGTLVYGHYGCPQDFDTLRANNINVTGVLVLLRSGKIGFAEKVRNAELAQAAGVLIYPDPSDFIFPSNADQEIESPFGHAHFGTGDPYTLVSRHLTIHSSHHQDPLDCQEFRFSHFLARMARIYLENWKIRIAQEIGMLAASLKASILLNLKWTMFWLKRKFLMCLVSSKDLKIQIVML